MHYIHTPNVNCLEMDARYSYFFRIAAGILLATLVGFFNPLSLDVKANQALAVAVLMISWWILEALPMPVVALVPLWMHPLLGIATLEETTKAYSNAAIFLFMGGFFIGLALEKWNLHKRIALQIMRYTGSSGNRIILGFTTATGLLSMWLSNTATAMMMFPMGLSVIAVIKEHPQPGTNFNHFALVLMLSIAYASNIGGMATIIGTPPNVALVSFMEKKYGYTIAFSHWMMLATPLSLLLLCAVYFSLTHWFFPNRMGNSEAANQLIKDTLKELGPLSRNERNVLVIFSITALLWITKDLLNGWVSFKIDDSMIAIFGGSLLFLTPAAGNEGRQGMLLEWSDTAKLSWGILLLFGGGIALASSLERVGIMQQMGAWLAHFSSRNGIALVFGVVVVSIFLSEVMSNVAQVIVLAPVVTALADALRLDPLLLGIPMTLAASAASMLPMGTPPNAIVFSSGYIRLKDMLKAGLLVNIISILLITLFCWYILPLIMQTGT